MKPICASFVRVRQIEFNALKHRSVRATYPDTNRMHPTKTRKIRNGSPHWRAVVAGWADRSGQGVNDDAFDPLVDVGPAGRQQHGRSERCADQSAQLPGFDLRQATRRQWVGLAVRQKQGAPVLVGSWALLCRTSWKTPSQGW